MKRSVASFRPSRSSGFRVLITAAEGYPALERAFLDAQTEIWACFRIFDPMTALRSAEARRIGRTWFDLIVATLRSGVRIRLAISDFDPIARPELHRLTWRSMRILCAARECAGSGADLDVVAAMHSARTGLVPRMLTWPLVRRHLVRHAKWLNGLREEARRNALAEMPGLSARLCRADDGTLRAPHWPPPALFPATHHQKIAVFDRRLVCIGGLDLNERRYDTPAHDRAGPDTWQDVQLMLDGPAAREAQTHVERFISLTAGTTRPETTRHLVRTISAPRPGLLHFGPRPVCTEILDRHIALARQSSRLIYLETQYLRDRDFARQLAKVAREKPALCLIVMLPAAPDDLAFDNSDDIDTRLGEWLQSRSLRILRRAFGNRMFVGAPARPCRFEPARDGEHERASLCGAPLVYIHSKVSIFDERAAIVSSANLNGRSLRWDTEAGIVLRNGAQVRELRRRILSHWLPRDAGEEFFDPTRAMAAWRALALENARRQPEDRRGFVLPFDLKATERWAAPVPVLPDEMV